MCCFGREGLTWWDAVSSACRFRDEHNQCYQKLFSQHGEALFSQVSVSRAPKPVVQELQGCHHATSATLRTQGKVKVRGRRSLWIPGGLMKMVPVTCSERYSDSTVLFEPLELGLPAGLLASPSLVRATWGTAYIPVVNVGYDDVLLYPRTALGTLDFAHVVSLPGGGGVTEVPSAVGEAPLGVASVSSHLASTSVRQLVYDHDLSSLFTDEQCKVRALLERQSNVDVWQEPRFPIDFLLGRVESPVRGSVSEWVEKHQVQLSTCVILVLDCWTE